MKTKQDKDLLANLFKQLPEEPLPTDFRANMMQQIMAEAERVKKRNERLSLLAIILASLVILGLGVVAFIYLGIPKVSISLSVSTLTTIPFYLYIGGIVLLLLWADYSFRRKYKEKHS